MAKFERTPNYRTMYPEASDKVIDCLRKGHRKMQYAEYDLKTERCKIDLEAETVTYTQSREDSVDRLMAENVQFPSETEIVEDTVIKTMMLEKLRECLTMLNERECELIQALFFDEKSEPEWAMETGISQQLINYRKQQILKKLKKLLN